VSERSHVYEFKLSLLEVSPSIWRGIQVPEAYSFWDLHVALQDAMGWFDYHLHLFRATSAEALGAVQVKGRDEPIEIYRLA
jgi:hypothetical protein